MDNLLSPGSTAFTIGRHDNIRRSEFCCEPLCSHVIVEHAAEFFAQLGQTPGTTLFCQFKLLNECQPQVRDYRQITLRPASVLIAGKQLDSA